MIICCVYCYCWFQMATVVLQYPCALSPLVTVTVWQASPQYYKMLRMTWLWSLFIQRTGYRSPYVTMSGTFECICVCYCTVVGIRQSKANVSGIETFTSKFVKKNRLDSNNNKANLTAEGHRLDNLPVPSMPWRPSPCTDLCFFLAEY